MTGSGLIETIRVQRRIAPLWRLHLERFTASAAALGLSLPARVMAPSGGADRIVRLLLDQDGISASQRSPDVPPPLRVVVVAERHPRYRFKTTARAGFDRASAEAQRAGADEPVLLAAGGIVAETARWGIYWWEGEQLCAPSMTLGILQSVARARIAELASIAERMVPSAEVARRAVFLANAARGIVEVASWNGNAVPQSQLTAQLAARFWP